MKELKLEVRKLERRETKQLATICSSISIPAICSSIPAIPCSGNGETETCSEELLKGFGALFVGCGSIMDASTPCALELFETIKPCICCE
jgi:hypothetical protein